jgi:hypothetical protein
MTTQFYLDSCPNSGWPAHRIASTWNGWAVPVVDRATLESVIQVRNETLTWEGDIALLNAEDRLRPDPEGLYTLDIGWTFTRSTDRVHTGSSPHTHIRTAPEPPRRWLH